MPPKKKPSTKPRQTKSAKPMELVERKPVPPVPRSLMPVWIGAGVIITLLIAFRYGERMRLPEFTMPELPEITLPELPSFSEWFPQTEQEEIAEPDDAEPAEPVMEVVPAEDKNRELLKQQLADAAQRIKQLEAVVQEKDKAIQYEIALRGKSLLGQYARLIEYAIEKGQPFPWELEQLHRFSAGNMAEAETIAKELVPYAQGVPSMEKLQDDFDVVAAEVYQRWRREDIGSGVTAVFWKMLHQIISIRKVGLVEGDSPEAVIARAEYHLRKGDVRQAYEELSAFKGSYASIVKPWMDEAKIRLHAMTFIDRLKELAQEAAPGKAQPQHEDTKNDLAQPKARPAAN